MQDHSAWSSEHLLAHPWWRASVGRSDGLLLRLLLPLPLLPFTPFQSSSLLEGALQASFRGGEALWRCCCCCCCCCCRSCCWSCCWRCWSCECCSGLKGDCKLAAAAVTAVGVNPRRACFDRNMLIVSSLSLSSCRGCV